MPWLGSTFRAPSTASMCQSPAPLPSTPCLARPSESSDLVVANGRAPRTESCGGEIIDGPSPPQCFRRAFAEPAAVILGKFAEMPEAAIIRDRRDGLARQRRHEQTVCHVQATIAQKLMRRRAEMAAKARLQIAGADPEFPGQFG